MSINPQNNYSGIPKLPPITNGQQRLKKKQELPSTFGPEKKQVSNKILLSPMRPLISPNNITDVPKTPTQNGKLAPINREEDVPLATKKSEFTQYDIDIDMSSIQEYSLNFEDASKENTNIWDNNQLLSELSISIGTEVPALGIDITRSAFIPSQALSPSQIYTQLNRLMTVGPKLGNGAFGEVREVTLINPPIATSMVAAAKFFSDYSDKGKASIRHEFDTLRSLQGKPGIIQLVNVDMTINDTLVGYAMEIGVGTLKTALAQSVFSIPETLKLAKDLITGGCSLEEAGLVHRDGKPDNVVKVPHGVGSFTWKKVDFGLTLREGAPFEDGGTLLYRSPESHGGTDINEYQTSSKQDVFADGLILAEALIKRLPHATDAPKTIINPRNQTAPSEESEQKSHKECPAATLIMRVFQEYRPRFYTPAVEKLNDVKHQFPESTALVNLAIRMIDPEPTQRPSFSECQRLLGAAYPD